jgi:hypothetical protein
MVALGTTIVLLNSGNYPSFSSYGNETWIFNGTNGAGDWTNLSTAFINANGPLGPSVRTPPVVMSARINQAMSFDGTNVMVYGGQGSSETAGVFQDTWVFNGTTWTLQAPATVPYGRLGAKAAALTGTGALMFGGALTNGQLLLETWTWNGTTWTQVAVANGAGPAARTGHAMASSGTTVVLFGGSGTNSQFNDTWTYTTAAGWTKLSPATSPSIRSGAVMSYDVTNAIWVLFGGMNEYNYLPETWTFNGTTWTQVTGAGPAGRVGAQMAWDPTGHTTILYGGVSAGTNYPSNATWSFNGATLAWTVLGA